MKKKYIVSLIFLLLLAFTSSVFASFNLDTTRWTWVGSNSNYGLFIDSKTIKPLYGNKIEFWVCSYHNENCKFHNIGEHYDYYLVVIDYNKNSGCLKSIFTLDSNKNVIEKENYNNYNYEPILPGSDGECIADAAYLLVYGSAR